MDQNSHQSITLIGLGPGDPELLTRQAWDWLARDREVYLLGPVNGREGVLPWGLKVLSLQSESHNVDPAQVGFDELDHQIINLAKRPGGVNVAIPGDPGEVTGRLAGVFRMAGENHIPIQVFPGVDLFGPALKAAGLENIPHGIVVDAASLAGRHTPSFPPTAPVGVILIDSAPQAGRIKEVLLQVYPPEHPVIQVTAPGSHRQMIEPGSLGALDLLSWGDPFTVLVIPPLNPEASLEAFHEIVARLRAPNGCPWDRVQTHQTLRTNLLEETYEALEAIDLNDPAKMAEELGDLLLQIVLHAQIASETGEFNLTRVIEGISAKIIRRHPHVFGNLELKEVAGVLQNWEKLKAAERSANGEGEKTKGLLDGVPQILPALNQAQEIQSRAVRVGFDWPSIQGVLEKIQEEAQEVISAPDAEALAREIGDLIFAIVNLARWKDVDAESALRETNMRFRRRFAHIEQAARRQGRHLTDMSLEEMDALWEEAKDESG